MHKNVWSILVPLWVLPSSAQGGLGYVGLGSDSFLKSSNQRANATGFIELGPKWAGEGNLVSGKVDGSGYMFFSDPAHPEFEVREGYVSTSPKLLHLHTVAFGRKIHQQGAMEKAWRLGMWNPQFQFDPLRPEISGLTGLHYTYRSKYFTASITGSGVHVPERGVSLREEGGAVVSSSPFFTQLPTTLRVSPGTDLQIKYEIDQPSLTDLLLRPTAVASIRVGTDKGPWGRAQYGYLPVHRLDLSLEPTVRPQDGTLEAKVHPRVGQRHLAQGEMGYNGKEWFIWGSGGADFPTLEQPPAAWIHQPMGNAFIGSGGAGIRWRKRLTLSASYITILESSSDRSQGSIDLDLPEGTLPSRFSFERAGRVNARWDSGSAWLLDLEGTYDLAHSSGWFSGDLSFLPFRGREVNQWAFGLGADFFSLAGDSGWLGQFQGNDRIKGTVSYVF